MTVKGFLTWYLVTVTIATASGAAMWQGIQSRKHLGTAAVVATSAPETPTPRVADARQTQLAESQVPATLPEPSLHQSGSAAALLPQLRAPMQSDNTARPGGGATQPWTGLRPRPARKVATRSPAHRYPQTVVAHGADVYAAHGPGSYEPAYPPSVPPRWQMRRYAYYYPYYGYYPRYPYYYYSAD
jgi:hypothetical protein